MYFFCLSSEISNYTKKKKYALGGKSSLHGKWGNSGNSVRLYFLGSKITAECDCSHEIKRCLLLGRKVMTNLNSIKKQRHYLANKDLSRLWFFQWPCMDMRVGLWRKLSIKELMLLNCGVGEDSWEPLGLQGDPTSPS